LGSDIHLIKLNPRSARQFLGGVGCVTLIPP